MKKFISGLIVGIIMAVAVTAFAAAKLNIVPNPFPVLIDGVETPVEGYNINGYTFLKLADFKKAGLAVKFNEADRQIEISKDPSFIPVEFSGINGYNKDGDIYISLKDALANKDMLVGQLLSIQSQATTPVTQTPMETMEATSLQKATLNGLNGIIYNGVFYVETSDLVQKYEILLNQKNTVCTIVSKRTGQTLTLSQTAEGYIKDTNGIYYLNYNTIKSMINTSDIATQPAQVHASTPTPAPVTLSLEEVDALQTTTKDGMTGVMYNGVFYAEKDSFYNKYKFSILFHDNIYTIINGLIGGTVHFERNSNGYLKNSAGTIYFNFNILKTIIK